MSAGEVKLLTVQMAEALGAMSPEARVRMLCERGLIAPEPELLEAREIAARARQANYANTSAHLQDSVARKIAAGEWDEHMLVVCALAALRRGMELRPPLTREELGDAIVKVFNEGAKGFGGVTPDNITRLHAALTDGGRHG